MFRFSRRSVLATSSALTLGSTVFKQSRAQVAASSSEWPTKPIRLIVPFPAGGGADLAARVVAGHLGTSFGKPITVENRAGADGAVAAMEVMRSPPDGHTLFFATASALSYVPSIKKQAPYDPLGDFTPISGFCLFTFYFMVSPSLGVRNMSEFIAYARSNPGKVSYATGNSSGILATAQLAASNKLDMIHVPYKGEAQAVIDLVGGRVHSMFATPAVLPQLLKEKFVPLAVLLPKRSTTMPEVPTMAEAGQALVNILPWGGLLGPAKMPGDLVERISRDFGVVMRRADVAEQYEKLGLFPAPSSPQALGVQIKEQLGVFAQALRTAGIAQE